MADDKIDRALEQVDPAKRAFLKGLVGGSAFLTPMVVSFSMEGVSLYQAHAGVGSNTTTITRTTVTIISDRNRKENIADVDGGVILDQVARLPITTWRYKGEAIRHIGPMAQDFAAAFQVGPDDRHIDLIDANGVALAAIQALTRRVETQEVELAALRAALERVQGSVNAPA
ncbi:MAG TPA: tail fiber domain-containing protein [Candidatus Methylomirabilis sp.]|nr:tail fiber domain-containing protein [Candidatus Methylomirabilis sp.]